MKTLNIDVETYSSVSLAKEGVYKYTSSPDFEVLIIAYSIDKGPIKSVSLATDEKIPQELDQALRNPEVLKYAHNATFERLVFNTIGYPTQPIEWRCTMIKAAYCGLPLSLDQLSKVLELGEDSKIAAGKKLITYFCIPCKPTKTNKGRTRNLPKHDPEKWQEFIKYCEGDVRAEMRVNSKLSGYKLPKLELIGYALDQKINDRGVKIDPDLAAKAVKIYDDYKIRITEELRALTALENPNSPDQLKKWLSAELNEEINTIAKKQLETLKDDADGLILEVLTLREYASKTSVKKYDAALKIIGDDGRARGLHQYYGANRTGRWAGRLMQIQNLPRNMINTLDLARRIVKAGDLEGLELLYENIGDVLSQLIRTVIIADKGNDLKVSDFSAIEARVLAWLACESWRLEVFKTHGKIYEASAAAMFNIPLESIGKGSKERDKGKVAELALGYGGGVGALKQMGGEKMGLSESEMKSIIKRWRLASPAIVKLWYDMERAAISSILGKKTVFCKRAPVSFTTDNNFLKMTLPSGRSLYYYKPTVKEGKYGPAIQYYGMDQVTKKWTKIDTYGGKLTENLTQAVARDILLEGLIRVDAAGFNIILHVHDELVAEDPETNVDGLEQINDLLAIPPNWCRDLPLKAEGFTTKYYKKD